MPTSPTRRQFLRNSALALAAAPWMTRQTFGAATKTDFDVIVYSGVPCGFAAAVAAARGGANVLLIEPTMHVGGLNTSGLNTAETEHMLEWTFGGVALEFYTRLGTLLGTKGPAYFFTSAAAEKIFNEMLAEARVTVRFGARVEKVNKTGTTINSIALSDGTTVSAKVFVDAGYEGDMMARAGVNYVYGREGREEFGESKAGVSFDPPCKAVTVDDSGALLPGISGWARDFKEGQAHRGVMNYNWRLTFTKDPAKRTPIPPPFKYDRTQFRLLENWTREMTAANKELTLGDYLDLYERRDGHVEVNNKQAAIISIGNFGAQFDYPDGDYAVREKIVAAHTEYTRGLLYFLANEDVVPQQVRAEMREHGLHKDEFADNGNWPYQLYVREGRRMRGAATVTQKDVTEERHKRDAIALGSHFVDSHHVQRLALSPTEFVNEGRIWMPGYVYQIPYGALTPKPAEVTNLLVPGAASYTHVAYCTYRLESTWMMGGHAAGTAAAMAARQGKAVQELEVTALQAKLREEKQIIDFLPGQAEEFEKKESK